MNDDEILEIVIDVVRAFVASGMLVEPDTPLLDSRALDSASMVNALLELESRLGITIGPGDLAFDHFQDCRLLAQTLADRVKREA